MKADGSIDRTTPREAVPFLERCETPDGVASELWELHRVIVEGKYLDAEHSDVADRFSLLMGIAAGTILRLSDASKKEAAGG